MVYVVYLEFIFYRKGYEEFKCLGRSVCFFRFVYSVGEFDERKISKNFDKRRIYIDFEDEMVYFVNI